MSHSQNRILLQGGLGQSIVRGTTMNYQMDSSGKAYAIGGEVKVDLRPENSTFATKKKADAIMAAALSPDRPSVQDRMVATQSSSVESECSLCRNGPTVSKNKFLPNKDKARSRGGCCRV